MTFPSPIPATRIVKALEAEGYRPQRSRHAVSVIRPESVTVDEDGKIIDRSRARYAPQSECPEGLEPFRHTAWGTPDRWEAACPVCRGEGLLVIEPWEDGTATYCADPACPTHAGKQSLPEAHEAMWEALMKVPGLAPRLPINQGSGLEIRT